MSLSIIVIIVIGTYEPGEFSHIAYLVAGKWLQVMIGFAAIISQLGLTNSGLIVADQALQLFALRHFPDFFSERSKSKSAVVRWMYNTDYRICPLVALFDCALLAALAVLDYNLLVSCSMILFNVSVVLFLVSYVMLKYNRPELDWPYVRTWQGAVWISTPIVIASAVMVFFSLYDDYAVDGIPHINLVSFLFIFGIGAAVHIGTLLARRVCGCFGQARGKYSEVINMADIEENQSSDEGMLEVGADQEEQHGKYGELERLETGV